MRELDLESNHYLEDISPLVGMRQLRVLNLAHNQISDLTPLMNTRSLRTLVLVGNPYDEDQLIRLQSALPKCDIVYR